MIVNCPLLCFDFIYSRTTSRLPHIAVKQMNTWIECVDFQKLLLAGLEEPLFKLGVVSLHRVFVRDWRGGHREETNRGAAISCFSMETPSDLRWFFFYYGLRYQEMTLTNKKHWKMKPLQKLFFFSCGGKNVENTLKYISPGAQVFSISRVF